MDFEKILPIGSVVMLKGAEKKLMIFGIAQTDLSSNTTYDYIGVVYPEGSMGNETHFLFNHSDIGEVFYRGYEDDERKSFMKNLEEFYRKSEG